MAEYHHRLEPQALIDAFVQHPPEGFEAHISANGTPWFKTSFDLFTLLEPEARQRLQQLPGFRFWRRLLRQPTCFVGTTVSEYSPLPAGVEPELYIQRLRRLAPECGVTIVKDMPCNSPLLSAAENHNARLLYEVGDRKGLFSVAGRTLAYVPIHFDSIDEYMASMSHSRRHNLRRKLRSRDELTVEVLNTGCPRLDSAQWRAELYRYYLEVYQHSDNRFELLTSAFFDALLQDGESGGRLFCYWHGEALVGFNLCYLHNEMLIDKYIGFDYSQVSRFNLYFVSWFVNLEYALDQGLRYYVAGWADSQVKAKLGANFTETRHLVWVRNPVLRAVLRRVQQHSAADYLSADPGRVVMNRMR